MKNLIQLLSVILVLLAGSVYAHSDHDKKPQTVSKEQAITTATYQVQHLVKNGQLDKSWEAIQASSAVFERRESRFNWIVSFNKPNQAEKNTKTLIFYLTSDGHYISNNLIEADGK